MTVIRPLSELCEIVIGRTPPRARSEYWGGSHNWLSIAGMGTSRRINSTKETISDAGAKLFSGRLAEPGTVLLSFKLSVGKIGIAEVPLYTNEAIAALPIRDTSVLHAEYLARYLEFADLLPGTDRAAMGNTLNLPKLKSIPIPLPPFAEQRRIAEILDQADELRARRSRAIAFLDELGDALFRELLAGSNNSSPAWPTVPLGTVSEQQGGLQVTRAREALQIEVPYLRVANVYHGSMDLSEVKTLRVTASELERVRLRAEDLLLVEGHGNPKEVGRAARWIGGEKNMVHQNHLIRVRVQIDSLNPRYAECFLNSEMVESHWSRVAKTTSGLNTINMGNVRSIPVLLPPMTLQDAFGAAMAEIQRSRSLHRFHLTKLDELFASLQHRAFNGEL